MGSYWYVRWTKVYKTVDSRTFIEYVSRIVKGMSAEDAITTVKGNVCYLSEGCRTTESKGDEMHVHYNGYSVVHSKFSAEPFVHEKTF